jgi:hypothetical protein
VPHHDETDRIAREAARRLVDGSAGTVPDAIRRAAEALAITDAPRPGPGRVRAHLRALTMQALGVAGYAQLVRDVLGAAEQLMTLLEETYDLATAVLVGRAARGEIDRGGTLHVRLYGDVRPADLAEKLVEHEYEEPSFETAETRHGRLTRLRFLDDDRQFVITLCPAALERDASNDLLSGRRIACVRLSELRARLEQE